jgi:hypothetical protein
VPKEAIDRSHAAARGLAQDHALAVVVAIGRDELADRLLALSP